MGANRKPGLVEGAGRGDAIGQSFPRARPIRARTEEPCSQWTAPPGAGAERQGNAVTAVNTHVEFVKGIGNEAVLAGDGE